MNDQALKDIKNASVHIAIQSVERLLLKTLDKSKLKGIFDKSPIREEITEPLNEQLVVELYSK